MRFLGRLLMNFCIQGTVNNESVKYGNSLIKLKKQAYPYMSKLQFQCKERLWDWQMKLTSRTSTKEVRPCAPERQAPSTRHVCNQY